MDNLKLFSIEKKLLSEKVTNWETLYSETKKVITNYLKEATKWHKFDYLSSSNPIEVLPSDCYSYLGDRIIDLWYPFYYDLERRNRGEIESFMSSVLFEIKLDS